MTRQVPSGRGQQEKLRGVTKKQPCSVCGGDHKCSIGDRGLLVCGRRTGPVPGSRHLGASRYDPQFNLYRRCDGPAYSTTPAAGTAVQDWHLTARTFEGNLTADSRRALADALRLAMSALDVLPGIGFDPKHRCWTFPECDGRGNVIGINRRFSDGTKRAMKGGKRGLTLPSDWRKRLGPVLLVEGPSDAIALSATGLPAVGRPSNTGGAALLVELLAGWPAERGIIVVGENDQTPDGRWPGRDGAERIAGALAEELRREIRVAYPPGGAKDSRQWITDRAGEGADRSRLGREFFTALNPVPFVPGPQPYQLPVILISTNEYEVNDMAAAALVRAPGIYTRGGQLVQVVEQADDSAPSAAVRRPVGAVVIRELPPPLLRDRLTLVARWMRVVRRGGGEEQIPAHPPAWSVQAVHV